MAYSPVISVYVVYVDLDLNFCNFANVLHRDSRVTRFTF